MMAERARRTPRPLGMMRSSASRAQRDDSVGTFLIVLPNKSHLNTRLTLFDQMAHIAQPPAAILAR